MQKKVLFLSCYLLLVILLNGCNNNVKNSNDSYGELEEYESDTASEDEKLQFEGFTLTASEMIDKLRGEEKLKEEQVGKETLKKFMLNEGDVEISMFVNSENNIFNCISIIDYKADSENYKVAYGIIMNILGESDDTDVLESIGETQVQIGNVWIKASFTNNEGSIIITSYQE